MSNMHFNEILIVRVKNELVTKCDYIIMVALSLNSKLFKLKHWTNTLAKESTINSKY